MSDRDLNCLRNAVSAGAVLIALCGVVLPAQAEGTVDRVHGQWGVNRRVTTQQGFAGASGSFTVQFGLPADRAGNWTPYSNPRNSRPSFYLGGIGAGLNGNAEVDAGLQYDWNEDDDDLTGWEAFIDVAPGGWCSPRVRRSDGTWGPWRGHDSTYTLNYAVTDTGHIRLTVGALGTFYWERDHFSRVGDDPQPGDEVMNANLIHSNRVKRVIAMTRDTNQRHDVDGSWMICIFQNGTIISHLGIEYGREAPQPWEHFHIHQGDTGYDTPGNPAGNPPPRRATAEAVDFHRTVRGIRVPSRRSRYKVDFPNLLDSNGNPLTPIELGRTDDRLMSREALERDGVMLRYRYSRETVRINLRTQATVAARRIRVGP